MFDKLDDFSHEESKGLFTFYREQAELEQQIKKRKKQRKQSKSKEVELKKKKQLEEAEKILLQPKQFQQEQLRHLDRQRKNLYEPKNRREKFSKHQIGNSVVIVNYKDQASSDQKAEHIARSVDRTNLKKIEQLINPNNNNRYFLQNKELPASFGRVSLEKMMIKNQQQPKSKDKQINQKNVIKQSYFNQYNGLEDQKKYIPSFSYQKLPELVRHKPQNSEVILPKRYKSKKIETALKSNNSELIKQIRQSIRQQSVLSRAKEDVSYLQINTNISKQINSYQIEYERRLNAKLDNKQRRLIDILRNSSQRRRKYQ